MWYVLAGSSVQWKMDCRHEKSKLSSTSLMQDFVILTYLLTPWSRVLEKLTGSQLVKKFCILWNPNIHYCIHRCPPVCILSQIDPVRTPTSNFLKMHLILSSHLHLDLPSGVFPSGFPTKTLYTPLTHTRYMPSPSHSCRFYHPHNIGWAVQIIKLLIM